MLSDESAGRQRHHSNWKYQDNLTHAEVFRKGVKSKLKIYRLCSLVPQDSEAPSDQLFVLPELTNIPVGRCTTIAFDTILLPLLARSVNTAKSKLALRKTKPYEHKLQSFVFHRRS